MDYAPHTPTQRQEMLQTIGIESFDELIGTVPPDLQSPSLDMPAGLAETDVIALCEALAARNRPLTEVKSFLGAGCYHHTIPTAVDAIAARGEWLTPYTPYQAEASQGSLQALYEFQTMICELMQMEVANASLYDGASSVAEAAMLAIRATGRTRVLLSDALHPNARSVLSTYLSGADVIIQDIPTINGVTDIEALGKSLRDDVACVIMQHPNVFGSLEPMAQAVQLTHRLGALFVASVYPISLGLLEPPGAYGADIAVAEGRCLGSPPAYGGPGLGLFTTTSSLMRRVPGRLAGCTVDQAGRRGFALTLQTREQHIRREKATSNICTNEGWLTLRATLFLSLLGSEGLRELAELNLEKAHYARKLLLDIPWITETFDQPFFNEFTLTFDPAIDYKEVERTLIKVGYVGGLPLKTYFPTMPRTSVWCVTETISKAAIDTLAEILKSIR